MSTMQLGFTERRGLQFGAEQSRGEQFGAGESHYDSPGERNSEAVIKLLQEIFQSAPRSNYVPPQEGLRVYLDYQAYMPDPVMLRETPAAKLFFETRLAYYSRR